MFRNIHSISVYVHDQDKAVEFYTKTLGFEKRADAPMGPEMRGVEVAPVGGQTVFTLVKGYAGWSAERVGQMVPIVLTVDDGRATVDALRAKGVMITLEPVSQAWGTNAAFKDPDGNECLLSDS